MSPGADRLGTTASAAAFCFSPGPPGRLPGAARAISRNALCPRSSPAGRANWVLTSVNLMNQMNMPGMLFFSNSLENALRHWAGYGAEEASGHWPSGRPRKAGSIQQSTMHGPVEQTTLSVLLQLFCPTNIHRRASRTSISLLPKSRDLRPTTQAGDLPPLPGAEGGKARTSWVLDTAESAAAARHRAWGSSWCRRRRPGSDHDCFSMHAPLQDLSRTIIVTSVFLPAFARPLSPHGRRVQSNLKKVVNRLRVARGLGPR